MRKLIISLLALFTIAGGTALAQNGYYAGVHAGYPGAGVHFGVSDVAPNLDFRANVGYSYATVSGFSIGADALYKLNLDVADDFQVYAGGGLDIAFAAGGAGISIHGLIGGEFDLASSGMNNGGIFIEVGPALLLSPTQFSGFARLGFNYHF